MPKSGMYNMMKSKIESNPRLLNLNRQTDPKAHDYVAEDVESEDDLSYNLSRIDTNSMERLTKQQKYEKN